MVPATRTGAVPLEGDRDDLALKQRHHAAARGLVACLVESGVPGLPVALVIADDHHDRYLHGAEPVLQALYGPDRVLADVASDQHRVADRQRIGRGPTVMVGVKVRQHPQSRGAARIGARAVLHPVRGTGVRCGRRQPLCQAASLVAARRDQQRRRGVRRHMLQHQLCRRIAGRGVMPKAIQGIAEAGDVLGGNAVHTFPPEPLHGVQGITNSGSDIARTGRQPTGTGVRPQGGAASGNGKGVDQIVHGKVLRAAGRGTQARGIGGRRGTRG